jgi:cell division protein FtsL
MKRRERTHLKPGAVIFTISACTVACLAGVGYIWAKSQVYSLGREMKALETRLDEVRRENAQLRQSYASECNPRELTAAVRRHNLGIVATQIDKIVRLPDPISENHTIKSYAAAPGGEP